MPLADYIVSLKGDGSCSCPSFYYVNRKLGRECKHIAAMRQFAEYCQANNLVLSRRADTRPDAPGGLGQWVKVSG